MKEIQITKGMVALVDDEDFEKVNKRRWCARQDGAMFYATAFNRINGKQRATKMHRYLLGNPPMGKVYDHLNGNTLDNRRENLIIVTRRQNCQNLHIKKSSRYPGVYWHKTNGKWQVRIRIGNKRPSLGYFTDEEKAFEAYKKALAEVGEKIHERWG